MQMCQGGFYGFVSHSSTTTQSWHLQFWGDTERSPSNRTRTMAPGVGKTMQPRRWEAMEDG